MTVHATRERIDAVCFGHDWSGDPLSKTHLMRRFARTGRVLWVDSIGYRRPTATGRDAKRALGKLAGALRLPREVEPNLFVTAPLAIPAHDLAWLAPANRALLAAQLRAAMALAGVRSPLVFVFNPTGAVVADALGGRGIVYYCVDDFVAYSDAGGAWLRHLEDALIARADLLVVSSQRLLETRGPRARRVALVRHGVELEHFRRALDPSLAIPDDLRGLPRPILGYFGLLAEDWIDVPLLEKLADRYAHGSLVLLGRATRDLSSLAARPNVHLLGRRPYASLPAYCRGFDVALNVFPINDVTLAANPLKVREYLAAGLPVVSTRIPEVEVLGARVRIARDHASFLEEVEQALRDPGCKRERSASVEREGWDARFDELASALAEAGLVGRAAAAE
jgi:glycosyltransferase involved in cell wall biosynthesis